MRGALPSCQARTLSVHEGAASAAVRRLPNKESLDTRCGALPDKQMPGRLAESREILRRTGVAGQHLEKRTGGEPGQGLAGLENRQRAFEVHDIE